MNKRKSFLALVVVAFLAAGFAFAAEGDKKPENKMAGCCAKAKAAGETCTHACCVEAAKEGKNCTKCGGSGDIQKGKKKKKAAEGT